MRRQQTDEKDGRMTPAGENYLMMIHELSGGGKEPVRIRDLSSALGVTPSSASRMATAMCADGYVNFRRYGYITLTEKGIGRGEYMRDRLDTVKEYIARLNGFPSDDEAASVAHCLSEETVAAMKEKIGGENGEGHT